jgi:hypothetical protein
MIKKETDMETTDFSLQNYSTVFLLIPNFEAAEEWIDENLDPEVMRWGHGVVIEHGYIKNIVDGLMEEFRQYEH